MSTERDELIANFSGHEVETTEDLLQCTHGPPTADKFRRLIMLFLRGHYSSADNFGETFEHLSCFVWTPGDGTKLHVDFSQKNDAANPDAYPGIYVRFGDVQYRKIAIGNESGNTQDMAGQHLSKEAVLTLRVEHVEREAGNAYDLAEMSARVLTAMAEPLALHSGATGFEVEGITAAKEKNQEPKQYSTVAMLVRITYTHGVTRLLESHRIRRIAQELGTQT